MRVAGGFSTGDKGGDGGNGSTRRRREPEKQLSGVLRSSVSLCDTVSSVRSVILRCRRGSSLGGRIVHRLHEHDSLFHAHSTCLRDQLLEPGIREDTLPRLLRGFAALMRKDIDEVVLRLRRLQGDG